MSGPEYVAEDRGHDSPCWIWQLAIAQGNGYGRKMDPRVGKVVPAHRIYWERENGPVPDGLTLDHLCRVRACVNPAHLEPVTQVENVRRASPVTPEMVRAIRRRTPGPKGTITRLAEELGLSFATVYFIAKNKSWVGV